MNVKITDNSKEVLSAFEKQLGLALSAIGHDAEGYAKEDCPVDTGRLRNSITNSVADSEKAVYIGTNVEYAVYVELNDKANHSPPEYGGGKAHFLRDACATHTNEYEATIKTILRQ